MSVEGIKKRLHLGRWRKQWEKYSTACLVVLLLLLFELFGDQGAWALAKYKNIMLSNTSLMFAVVGLSIVMLGGNIDLSIGYQVSITSVTLSMLSAQRFPDWIVILGVLAVGLLCGLLNGILVGYLGIVSFAATIATQIIFRGLSFFLSKGRMSSYMVDSIRKLTRTRFLGVRIDLLLAILAFFLLWLFLHHNYLSKHLRAIGLDESTAVRAGIKTKQVKCLSYCVAGLFYAMAAMVLASKKGYSGSESGVGMEITATVAAYVGGILNFASKRNVVNLILGALAVAIIENGLVQVGLNIYIQYIVTGLILIVSMTFHKIGENG